MRKTITIEENIYRKLRDYKNFKSLNNDKDLSFSDAIQDLLENVEILSKWMKGKKKDIEEDQNRISTEKIINHKDF